MVCVIYLSRVDRASRAADVFIRERCIITIYNSPSCLIVLSATFNSAALSALGMAVAKTFWSFSTVSYSSLSEPSRRPLWPQVARAV